MWSCLFPDSCGADELSALKAQQRKQPDHRVNTAGECNIDKSLFASCCDKSQWLVYCSGVKVPPLQLRV